MSEILAPAGSIESVYAAVRCGADAVYLAGESFNARRGAKNFTFEQLKEAVDYCHSHGVKVYHALNTLVKDCEIDALKEEIKRILAIGEDALILQDPGVARLVKAVCPEMPLHASTQLTAHSLSAVRALERRGFKRAVLAREMTREEILNIRRGTEMELEMFVHGALCMCVSGQCLLSAFLGARSGNRGLCAQPCRLPFAAPGGTGYDLSLKDNSLLEYLPALQQAGIDSFKIEGRMKRPEYVAASVSACKAALAGTYTPAKKQDLQNIFSRQGFTDGYFTGKSGKEMFGTRAKENVTAADTPLLKTYAALYHKEVATVPCTIEAVITADTYPQITMSALGSTVTVRGSTCPETARNRELGEAEVKERLSKLGGTPFFAQTLTVTLEKGLMLGAACLNSLRREAAEQLTQQLMQRNHYVPRAFPPAPRHRLPKEKQRYLRFACVAQTASLTGNFDKIILPLEEAELAVKTFGTEKLILETPRVFFGKEATLTALLDTAKTLGVQEIAIGNLGALLPAKERGFQIFAGFGMNIMNSYAAEELDADTTLLSVEMSAGDIRAFCSERPYGVITYGHIPLMITRNCPLKNGQNCADCRQTGAIIDRKGEHFPVRCRFGASEIFNPHALYLCDKEAAIPCDFTLYYFTIERPEEAAHILALADSGGAPDFPFTRGLYQKGVL